MANEPGGSQGGIPEEPEVPQNEERWLLTYSDMMTLLVAFFIMMYSVSVINLAKFKELTKSVKNSLAGQMEGKNGEAAVIDKGNIAIESVIPNNQGGKDNELAPSTSGGVNPTDAIFNELKHQLMDLKISKKLQGMIDIKERGGNIYIVIVTDKIFFRPGEAVLTDEAKDILKNIGALLSPMHNEITVEGYTSSVPPSSNKFENNWELSAARLISVINFFIQVNNLAPERLSLTGYGQWRPMFGGPEDMKNDRVIIAVLKKTAKGGK